MAIWRSTCVTTHLAMASQRTVAPQSTAGVESSSVKKPVQFLGEYTPSFADSTGFGGREEGAPAGPYVLLANQHCK
jgi:hypothetical protein